MVVNIEWPTDKPLTLSALRELALEPANGHPREWHITLSHKQTNAVRDIPGFSSVTRYAACGITRLNAQELGCCESARFFGPDLYIGPNPVEQT